MTKKRILLTLAVLFLLYTAYYLLTDSGIAPLGALSRKAEHIILFISITLVYVAGSIGLKGSEPEWLRMLWHIFHVVLIPLLLILGSIDWLMGGLPKGWRHFAQTIGETLVSPVLFVGVALLQKAFKQPSGSVG